LNTHPSVGSDDDEASAGGAGVGDDYTYYTPAHSDYLIHWTGRDIDDQHDVEWYKHHSSTTDSTVTSLYLDRLRGILRHGLWMTADNETVTIAGHSYPRPTHFRTCFSELKLSTVRGHARRYGRLGIGFKRFFLFDRLGCPMTYYHSSRANWFTPCLWTTHPSTYDEFFACFLKPMTETTPDTTMRYAFYDECEWRIIYSADLAQRLIERRMQNVARCFVRNEDFSPELRQLVLPSPCQPGAVIPVKDRWCAMIIYPSLAAKAASEADQEIRSFINALKPVCSLPTSYPKRNPAWLEQRNRPAELDLDTCRHF
jgi:hypothetical protein